MLRRRDYRPIARQRGVVLLVLAVMISVMTLGWLYARIAGQRNADTVTFKTLAIARAALIGRAVADTNHPGSLPCPDTDNDGVAQTTVGQEGGNCPGYIGRLPWRTLGLSDIRDANGDRLWYALSSDARDYQNLKVNSQLTAGNLQLNGNGDLVAVLLSPGVVIAPQLRDVSHENNVGNYLEGENAIADNVYESRPVTDPAFNDKVLTLSSAQAFRITERRILQQIAEFLTQYDKFKNEYPFAAEDEYSQAQADLLAANKYCPAQPDLVAVNKSGQAQANLLAGYIPFFTLYETLCEEMGKPLYVFDVDAFNTLLKNDWFDALAISPLLSYTVSAARDQVQINLKYCHGNMTRDTPMVVHCD